MIDLQIHVDNPQRLVTLLCDTGVFSPHIEIPVDEAGNMTDEPPRIVEVSAGVPLTLSGSGEHCDSLILFGPEDVPDKSVLCSCGAIDLETMGSCYLIWYHDELGDPWKDLRYRNRLRREYEAAERYSQYGKFRRTVHRIIPMPQPFFYYESGYLHSYLPGAARVYLP